MTRLCTDFSSLEKSPKKSLSIARRGNVNTSWYTLLRQLHVAVEFLVGNYRCVGGIKLVRCLLGMPFLDVTLDSLAHGLFHQPDESISSMGEVRVEVIRPQRVRIN